MIDLSGVPNWLFAIAEHAPRASLLQSSLFPLWEKVARTQSATDEGFASAERDPSPGFASRNHPLPQGERVKRQRGNDFTLSSDND
jgi:hypothetical protein